MQKSIVFAFAYGGGRHRDNTGKEINITAQRLVSTLPVCPEEGRDLANF